MALQIRKVNKAVLPKSNMPGRIRQPSEFDGLMKGAYDDWKNDPDNAWQEVMFDGSEEEFNNLTGELNRAAIYGKYGKSVRGGLDDDGDVISYVKDENGEDTDQPCFYFQIRDKKNTGKKGPRGPRKNKLTGEALRDADGNVIELDDDDDSSDETTSESSNDNGNGNVDNALADLEQSVETAKSESGKRGRKTGAQTTHGWS